MPDGGTAVAAPPLVRPRIGPVGILPPALVLAVLFLYPLALIVREALVGDVGTPGESGLASSLAVLASPFFVHALGNTVLIAVAATAGCVLVGLVLALLLSFVPFPGAGLVARLIDTFVALPTFLVTLAFTFLYGSAGILNEVLVRAFGFATPPIDFLYTAWGVVLAEVTVYTPFVLRPLLAAFSQLDRAQVEVASVLGARPWRIVHSVILPAAVPALAAGGSLCLLLTVNEFGIVLFIGAKGVITLPLLVYDKAIQESAYAIACTIAVVNIALSLALFGLYRMAAARFET